MQTEELRGKVCLVTGAASGMGHAIATLFLREGAHVCLVDIDGRKGKSTMKKLSTYGKKVFFSKTDVTSERDVRESICSILKTFQKLDVVVNAAGVLELGPISSYNIEKFRLTVNVNLLGVFLVCKYAIRKMTSGGSIINIGSSLGIRPFVDHGGYCASKAAVIQLTRVMALEGAKRRIRVNVICPGPIKTPMLTKEIKQSGNPATAGKMFKNEVPLNRFGKPEEVANLALFLASDRSSYMTGATLNIDGGDSLK